MTDAEGNPARMPATFTSRRERAGTARIVLARKLDQKAALALVDELRAATGGDLDLDAGATTHVGTLAVQAILSAARTWSAAGHRLRLCDASDACIDQLGLLGLTPESLVQGGAE